MQQLHRPTSADALVARWHALQPAMAAMPQGLQRRCTEMGNIALPTGENAVPYLVPEVRLQAGAVLHLLPDTTKNKKGEHCKIAFTRDVMCFSTWFQMAVRHHADAGQPIPITSLGHWGWEPSSLLRSQ